MTMPGWLWYTLVTLPVWLVLLGSVSAIDVLFGVVVVLASFPLVKKLVGVPDRIDARNLPGRIARTTWYVLGVFIPDVIRSTLDMAYRVLHPAMPMRPVILAVRIEASERWRFLALVNHFILAPGQLIVDIEGEGDHIRIYAHCIDSPNIEKTRRDIAAHFDRGRRILR